MENYVIYEFINSLAQSDYIYGVWLKYRLTENKTDFVGWYFKPTCFTNKESRYDKCDLNIPGRFDMDEDEIIQQAMNEDNKIANDQLQQSDDMMDMDLIKRAETNYMPMPMSGDYIH